MPYNFYQTHIFKNLSLYNRGMRNNSELLVLFYLIKFFKFKNILEIGFFEGKTFGVMIESSTENSNLTAIDIMLNKKIYDLLYDNSSILGNRQVNLVETNSLDFLPDRKYDFINIDTSHNYPETLNEIKYYLRHVSESGILMLDDYMWPGVDKSIGEFMYENSEWVPFLMGEQAVFFHHVSHNASEFLDQTLNVLSPFCSLNNVDYKSHIVKKVSCLPAVSDHEDIFTMICQRYKL